MEQIVEERPLKKSWEEYVSSGMEAREDKDNCQWKLGDLSSGIEKDYGEDSIGKFAYAIGVERKTIMNYRTIAKTFPISMRTQYKKLSFSHFSSLANVEKPEAWLIQADNNDWSVEHLRKEVNEAYKGLKEPELKDTPPEAIRCPKCGLWRFKDLSKYEICKGHYDLKGERMVYE
jgi:hypothetical protein